MIAVLTLLLAADPPPPPPPVVFQAVTKQDRVEYTGPPMIVPSPSPPPQPRPSVITAPSWIRKPNGDDLSRFYPPAALERGVEGRAVVDCLVTNEGLLTDCTVVMEEPAGMQFGAATLRVTSRFKMRPTAADGTPVGGAHVRLPMNWRIAGGPAEPPPPTVEGLVPPADFANRSVSAQSYGERVRGAAVAGAVTAGVPVCGGAVRSLESRSLVGEWGPVFAGQPAYLERVRVEACGHDSTQAVVIYLDRDSRLTTFAMPPGESRAGPGLTAEVLADIDRNLHGAWSKPICPEVGPPRIGTVVLTSAPDRKGRWSERWPVMFCAEPVSFEVTFTPGRRPGEATIRLRRQRP